MLAVTHGEKRLRRLRRDRARHRHAGWPEGHLRAAALGHDEQGHARPADRRDPRLGDRRLAGLTGTMTIDIQPGGKHFYDVHLHAPAGRRSERPRTAGRPPRRRRSRSGLRAGRWPAPAARSRRCRRRRRASRLPPPPRRHAPRPPSATPRSPPASIPHVEKPRVVVMTDIANEPDDQMSMVRFLVYANQFDVEGLVATTSTWMRDNGPARRDPHA